MTAPEVIATYPAGRATMLHLAELGARRTLCGVELGHTASGTGVTRDGRRPEPECRRCARSIDARSTATGRRRLPLTPHQRGTLTALRGLAEVNVRAGQDGWVPLRWVGSRGALGHLVDRGWAEVRMRYGPRGGERPEYRPIAEPVGPAPHVLIGGAAPGGGKSALGRRLASPVPHDYTPGGRRGLCEVCGHDRHSSLHEGRGR